ncbi:hypothetical protein SAMN05660330_04352, partial [Desulforhopalus singaporensis]
MKVSAYQTSKALPPTIASGRKVRKHLNADSLLAVIRRDFQNIP